MGWSAFQDWLGTASIVVLALYMLLALAAAAAMGAAARRLSARPAPGQPPEGAEQHGYIISAVLGLLALLLGFTFSLAAERFEARRYLVAEEANAIGTAYLRAQLLPEPHRARAGDLLVRYTDNRIALAKAPRHAMAPLLARNDALLTEIWTATRSAYGAISTLPFSGVYVASINRMIDLDLTRKMARAARVPGQVYVVLFVYALATAAAISYLLTGPRGAFAAGLLFLLLTLSLVLIIDIDRPTDGGIVEGQLPMEMLRKSMLAQPPSVFDEPRAAQAPR